jgi:hypothetical protein
MGVTTTEYASAARTAKVVLYLLLVVTYKGDWKGPESIESIEVWTIVAVRVVGGSVLYWLRTTYCALHLYVR